MNGDLSISGLLRHFTEETGEPVDVERAALAIDAVERETTWYIQALSGFGGWMAALFFTLVFSFFIALFLGGAGSIIIGTFSLVAGGGLAFLSIRMIRGARGRFAAQLALALQLESQALLWFGAFALTDFNMNFGVAMILLVILQLVMFPLFDDRIFRFLSTLFAVFALNALVYEWSISYGLSVLIFGFTLALAVIYGGVLPNRLWVSHREWLMPLGYGLIFGLSGTIIHELTQARYIEAGLLAAPLTTSVGLLAILIWLERRVMHEYGLKPNERAMLVIPVATILAALPVLTAPGIIAGVLLIVLGFRRQRALMQWIAYLYIAGFISHYYYALNATLLVKSFVLMGTGIALLLVRFGFRRLLPVSAAMKAEKKEEEGGMAS